MHFSKISILALASSILNLATAQDITKIGWTGTLSSLDGGLGGIISVVDSKTLQISNYKLADASAPALYWWGSTTDSLKDGFRISSVHVTEKAKSNSLTINLDVGKTSTDFATVGLWCEKFSANFGQAKLAPPAGDSLRSNASSASGTTGIAAAAPSKTGAGVAHGVGWGVMGASVLFAAFLL